MLGRFCLLIQPRPLQLCAHIMHRQVLRLCASPRSAIRPVPTSPSNNLRKKPASEELHITSLENDLGMILAMFEQAFISTSRITTYTHSRLLASAILHCRTQGCEEVCHLHCSCEVQIESATAAVKHCAKLRTNARYRQSCGRAIVPGWAPVSELGQACDVHTLFLTAAARQPAGDRPSCTEAPLATLLGHTGSM